MNYSKNIDSYGSEFWSFNAAGVSYPNKDGTLRQDIIGALNCGSHYNCRIDEYLYQEEKAYYIVIDGKIVGNVPRNIAKEFAAKSAAGYIMEITAAGIHGGPSADFDDDDDDGNVHHDDPYLGINGLLLGVAQRGGDVDVVVGEVFLHPVEGLEALVIVLGVVEGDGVKG